MIRKTVRRGGLLVATTALAGAAFAGSAAAGTGDHYDPHKHNGIKDKATTSVTGSGGAGGDSSVSQDNCTAIYNAPLLNVPIVIDATGTILFEQSFDATQCNVAGTGDAGGGDGIEAAE